MTPYCTIDCVNFKHNDKESIIPNLHNRLYLIAGPLLHDHLAAF